MEVISDCVFSISNIFICLFLNFLFLFIAFIFWQEVRGISSLLFYNLQLLRCEFCNVSNLLILILLISKHENSICFPRGSPMIWAEFSCVISLCLPFSKEFPNVWLLYEQIFPLGVPCHTEKGNRDPTSRSGEDFIFCCSTCPDAGQLPSYLPQTGHRVKNDLNYFLWGVFKRSTSQILSSWYKTKCLIGQELHWDFRR